MTAYWLLQVALIVIGLVGCAFVRFPMKGLFIGLMGQVLIFAPIIYFSTQS